MRYLLSIALFIAVSSAAATLHAGAPPDDDPYAESANEDDPYADTSAELRAAAREHGKRGLDLFNEKKWEEAYNEFTEAERSVQTPPLTLYRARCKRELGKLIEARDLYQKVVERTLSMGASKRSKAAQASARSELERLAPRIASLRVAIHGPPAGQARVTLDGAALPASESIDQEIDPGEHSVTVESAGFQSIRRTLSVGDGSSVDVDWQLLPIPAQVSVAIPPAALAPAPDSLPGTSTSALLAIGLGGAGIGASVTLLATGLMRDDTTAKTGLITAGVIGIVGGSIALGKGISVVGSKKQNRERPQAHIVVNPSFVRVAVRF